MAINISGTVYTDKGVTTMGSGRTVAVSVNGAAAAGTTTTAADGTYTISAITAASGAVLTLYLQGNTEVGLTITRSTGSDMTGVVIYQDYVITRNDQGTLTAANTNTACNNGATGITSMVTAHTTSSLTLASSKQFLVQSGFTFAPGVANFVLTTSGNVTVDGTLTAASAFSPSITGADLVNNGIITIVANSAWTVGGSFTNNGTVTSAKITLTLGGVSSHTFKSNSCSFREVIINGGGTYVLQDALTTPKLTASSSSTLDVNVSGNYTINLGLSGSANTWSFAAGTFLARQGTVTMNLSAFTLTPGSNPFYDLVLNASSTYAYAGTLTITHSLTISSTTAFTTISGTALVMTGATLVNNGVINLAGNDTLIGFVNDIAHGTINYNGNSTYTSLSGGNTYYNLTFANVLGTWQPNGNISVAGNLTITAGTLDLSASNVNLSVAGNWSNSGTFTAGTGTVTLNGTNQTISGSTTFSKLSKVVSSTDTLTFTAGTTQNVTTSLTLQGAVSNLLTITGSSTWNISVPATQTLSYLNVVNSNNTGTTAAAGSTSTDGGGNTNWTFSSVPVLVGGSIGIGQEEKKKRITQLVMGQAMQQRSVLDDLLENRAVELFNTAVELRWRKYQEELSLLQGKTILSALLAEI